MDSKEIVSLIHEKVDELPTVIRDLTLVITKLMEQSNATDDFKVAGVRSLGNLYQTFSLLDEQIVESFSSVESAMDELEREQDSGPK